MRFEVIIVTSDPTYQVPTEGVPRHIRLLYEEGGPAHKRNVGVRYASGKHLVFLDDDVEVGFATLHALWCWLEDHPKCGMVFAKIYNMERRREFDDCGSWLTWTGFLWARAGNGQTDHGQYDIPERCLASKSATCGARREAFFAAGGFDSSYFILGEETDLAWRMWLRGWECWYNPLAVSWHAFGTSLKPKTEYYTLERIHRYGCRNYLSLLLTNLGAARLWRIFPCHLLGWVVAALGFALSGKATRAKLVCYGLWDVLRGLPRILQKRKTVQQLRCRCDRQLMPLISRQIGLGYYLGRITRYVTQGLHG